ncbi:N-acetylmuramoyl-L-alanine amidase [Bogoriella caseilytica]|uniref:N-acetylmuramoyl-L-alanine amidase n=1 Tax=Bogoriella caseilytica TaxID=56055 RepID=A0A3N2BA22_9MICO|nr:N-acetylmuramoyl-L-alanine amidase [Bogoriella caseilytica]ROR72119.1 N-acetylmuramoyl-L-alanine amidase [Bogoriella caseilytica]
MTVTRSVTATAAALVFAGLTSTVALPAHANTEDPESTGPEEDAGAQGGVSTHEATSDPAPVQYLPLTDDAAERTSIAVDGAEQLAAQPSTMRADESLEGIAVLSEPVQTEHFLVAGLTWAGSEDPEAGLDADLDIFLRVYEAEGWSPWLPICTCPACAGVFITGGATGVQIQISGDIQELPTGLELALIPDNPAEPEQAIAEIVEPETARELPTEDPVVPASAFAELAAAEAAAEAETHEVEAQAESSTSESQSQASPQTTSAMPASGPAAPTIISRAGWSADEANTTWPIDYPVEYPELRSATLHHTAGTNNYTAGQSAGIVRGIWHFHRWDRNWGDIGYNFLVDRFGQVFEGRKGTLDSPAGRMVVGGHASGHNTGSLGIAVMGDFTSTSPPEVVYDRFVEIIAWQFHRAGIDARTTTTVGSTSGLPRIYGHRRVQSTTCPGQAIVDRIPGLIQRVYTSTSQHPPYQPTPPECEPVSGASSASRQYVVTSAVTAWLVPRDNCAEGSITLPVGATLQATRISASRDWLEVQTPSGPRWVARSAVDYATSSDIARACTDPAGTRSASRQYVVRTGTLGWAKPLLRCGTDAVSMPAGTVLQATRISASGLWLEVHTQSGRRWVARDSVDYASSAQINAACTDPNGTRGASRQYVVQSSTVGWRSPFERCGAEARSIGAGTVVQATRISASGQWLEIQTAGGPRWVRRDDVSQCATPAGTRQASRLYVAQDATSAGVSPIVSSACGPEARHWGTGTAPISISAGAVVQATRISASGQWLQIQTRAGNRWVPREDLTMCGTPSGTRAASRQYVVESQTQGWVSPLTSSACGPRASSWEGGTAPHALNPGTVLQATRVSASGQWLEVQTAVGLRWVARGDVSIR